MDSSSILLSISHEKYQTAHEMMEYMITKLKEMQKYTIAVPGENLIVDKKLHEGMDEILSTGVSFYNVTGYHQE